MDREVGILLLQEEKNKYQALDHWFNTVQGEHVANAFAAELLDFSKQVSGQTLLQLGSCGKSPWLNLLHFRHKWQVSTCVSKHQKAVQASLTDLPFDRSSVDCIVLPLTLDAFCRDMNLLDEVDRILKPMGVMIFWGINPVSFWGAGLRWGRIPCFGTSVKTKPLTSLFSVKRAMLHRGYVQCHLSTFYYIPPVSSETWIKRFAFLNVMGKMIWPFPPAFYCFIVQKHEAAFPPLYTKVSRKKLDSLIVLNPIGANRRGSTLDTSSPKHPLHEL